MKEKQSLADQGRLVVGIHDAPPAPMQIGSPEAGDFRGYEVDLLNEFAARLTVLLQYRRNVWSTIINDLREGQIDLVCSAALVTRERQQEVDFSEPYLTIDLAIARLRGDGRGKRLAGEKVGVRSGTTAES